MKPLKNPLRKGIKKFLFIFICLVLLLVIVGNFFLPSLLLSILNKKAAITSPYLSFHAKSANVSLLQGKIHLGHIVGKLGVNGKVFGVAESLQVTIPWNKIFSPDRQMLLLFNKIKLTGSKALAKALEKDGLRLKARRLAGHRPVLSIERLEWKDSEISLPGQPKMLTHFNAQLTNLNPNPNHPYSQFRISANILESSPLKVDGTIRLRIEPLWWNLDLEMKNFNPMMLQKQVQERTGMLIKSGAVDLFGEIHSKDGKTQGYIKPFLKNLAVKIPHSGFRYEEKNMKEPNLLVKTLIRNSEHQIIASKVEFTFEKTLSVDVIKALKTAIEGKVKPGIENKLNFL